MPSTQQILQALTDMQANAQRALPVTPNNGNPMGAYNVPRTGGNQPPTTQAYPQRTTPLPPHLQPGQSRYPWMQPSESMQNVQQILQSRRPDKSSPLPPHIQQRQNRSPLPPNLPNQNPELEAKIRAANASQGQALQAAVLPVRAM